DADDAVVAIHHGQAANVFLPHHANRVHEEVVGHGHLDVSGHDLRNRHSVRISAFGEEADGEVAVGDHAEDAAVLADRNDARVLVAHEASGLAHGGVGRQHPRI